VIIFGSVWFLSKTVTKPVFLKKPKPKPNRNWFKPTGFGSVILEQKLVFSGLSRFFFGSCSVRIGFFGLKLIKLNRTGWFFKNSNRFN